MCTVVWYGFNGGSIATLAPWGAVRAHEGTAMPKRSATQHSIVLCCITYYNDYSLTNTLQRQCIFKSNTST